MTETKTPFVLGVVGDSGSGKSTIADSVSKLLGSDRTSDVRLDDYHRFTREERAVRGVTALNPMVHNTSLMQEHLLLLRQGRPIRNRSYDHADGTFGPIRSIEPHEVVIVRGLLGYPTDEMRGLYHLAVFLHPEAELLFRWKLRRDVLSRGYTEADVLKSIARHLLDSKEYVLPQADRADVVIRQELPDWEAEDADVRTTIVLRRAAAAAVMEDDLLQGLDLDVRMENEEALVELPVELAADEVAAWGRRVFPETYDDGHVGRYSDDTGQPQQRPQLAVVEVLIAGLVESLRRRMASA
jgi:phosphoribulokinase